MYDRTVVLACLLLCAPLSASAQQQDTAQQQETVPQRTWQRAASNNWYLRLIVPGPDTVAGRVRYSRGQARVDGDPVPQTILRIERRVERGNGALIGGLVGFVAGGLMGGSLADGLSEGADGAVLRGIAVVGGLGGIIGLLAGQAAAPGRVEWEPLWMDRRPDR